MLTNQSLNNLLEETGKKQNTIIYATKSREEIKKKRIYIKLNV